MSMRFGVRSAIPLRPRVRLSAMGLRALVASLAVAGCSCAHVPPEAVVWTYHEAFPSKYTPSVAELKSWDDQLVQTYKQKLRDVLSEFRIPFTGEHKSRVLILGVVSSGAAGRKTQVRNACKYYRHTTALEVDATTDG